MTKIKKLLIANRGEIALRIIHACKELGIKSVAIYSDFDKNSVFVSQADEAYPLNGNQTNQTYNNIKKIIEIAKNNKISAVHPGYGFLSESNEFSKQCEKAGLIFIGPNWKVMKKLGLKAESKKIADKIKMPRSPGSLDLITNLNTAKKIAKEIGFPVIIKATGGGGGKGMRIVYEEKNLDENLKAAQAEAKNSFSEAGVFIEKFIENPRHIEVQIIGDSFGEVVHFFERECSIQRKHQKLVEEAPSSFLTEEERNKLGEYAVNLAKYVGYVGAGTVEFICDKNRNFYFCEMNTRIQVEHGITELATNHDLIKEQIRVCSGEPLSVKQKDIKLVNHAFECRINAEDPSNSFFPSTGKIYEYNLPVGGGVRVDSGYQIHSKIPQFYDSLVMKLMSYGENREEARKKMIIALNEFKIKGIITNAELFKEIFKNKTFIKSELGTDFLKNEKILEKLPPQSTKDPLIASICSIAIDQYYHSKSKTTNDTNLPLWIIRQRK